MILKTASTLDLKVEGYWVTGKKGAETHLQVRVFVLVGFNRNEHRKVWFAAIRLSQETSINFPIEGFRASIVLNSSFQIDIHVYISVQEGDLWGSISAFTAFSLAEKRLNGNPRVIRLQYC